jgi:hypothetical protein
VDQLSFESLMQVALEAIDEVQSYSQETNRAYMHANGLFPPHFPDGKGKFYVTTEAGADAVRKIGLQWRGESKDRQRRLNEESAARLSRETFGEALASTLWVKRTDARAAWKDVRDRLEIKLLQISRNVEHSFPCQILKDFSVGTFSVGPVTFRPRLHWLSHVEATAGKKLEWIDGARAVWEGKVEPPADDSLVSLDVRSITRHFDCPWIATASVEGSDVGRSSERGRLAARLAVDALGAFLEHRHALKFRILGDRLASENDATFAQAPGGYFWRGASLDVAGLDGKPGVAHGLVASTTKYREAAGRAIQSFVSVAPSDKPALYQRWCDALFWFGEARRDKEDFMALTRYGICLDVLASGGEAHGITKLVALLLEKKPDDTMLKDGTSLRMCVERIYKEGRSRFGHGVRPALLEDLPFPRLGADTVAMHAIERYVLCLAEYTGADVYDDFLRSIPMLLPQAISQ